MNNAKIKPLLAASFLAGLLGGLISHFVVGTTLFAQSSSTPRLVTAQRFALVDENGKLRGVWGPGPEAVGLVMLRPDGETLSGQFIVDEKGKAAITFFDENGKAIWTAGH